MLKLLGTPLKKKFVVMRKVKDESAKTLRFVPTSKDAVKLSASAGASPSAYIMNTDIAAVERNV